MPTFHSQIRRPDLSAFHIIAIPDDDERWKGVAPMTVLGDGREAYVRESEWPTIREALDAAIAQRGGNDA